MKKFYGLMAIVKAFCLNLFADSGTLTNATTQYVNAYTGEGTAFSGTDTLTPTMKEYYDTELLENHRDQLIFAQLGKKQPLPANRGRTVEWRKWNTLPLAKQLTEGVIPTGEKMGMTAITVALAQYGQFVAVTDLLKLHALDDVIAGAVEEIGASSGKTHDILVRNVLKAGTNILFADAYNGDSYVSTPATESALQSALGSSYKCDLTPDMINKAVTNLQVGGAPTFSGGKYVAVIHPHVAYALRKSNDWVEAHKYARPEEIFSGEIGELHGCRFIVSNLAPIIKGDGQSYATYKTMFFGKDAFGVIDPEGAGMQTIIHDAARAGGPLEQFSTIGTKFEIAAKILYPERMCTVWSGSPYSGTDAAN
jgi:N4-gp56 family major capsid protein